MKPAVGNEITLSTCQLDFCLPAKFQLTYVDKDGEMKTPVVLHRAILGSLDRFMAYILEETKGNLPTWLAPIQVKVMPVKTDDDDLNAYANEICELLEAQNVRVDLDDRAEKLGYRMREGQIQKVPYLLVIGFNEKDNRRFPTDFTVRKIQQLWALMNLLRRLLMRSRTKFIKVDFGWISQILNESLC